MLQLIKIIERIYFVHWRPKSGWNMHYTYFITLIYSVILWSPCSKLRKKRIGSLMTVWSQTREYLLSFSTSTLNYDPFLNFILLANGLDKWELYWGLERCTLIYLTYILLGVEVNKSMVTLGFQEAMRYGGDRQTYV